MNPSDMMRIVDSLHREKNIDKELVFLAIESALITAAKKHYGELEDIVVTINRETGELSGRTTASRWIRPKSAAGSGPRPPSR